MNTVTKAAPLGTLGLPSGDHWVRFHVEGETISFEVTQSLPHAATAETERTSTRKPTGFVQKWGGSVRKLDDPSDPWLTRINDKHLR